MSAQVQAKIQKLNVEPYSSVKSEKVLMTPEMAAKLLEKNIANRPMNKSHLKYLEYLMTSGQWQLNGDAIRIAADGVVLDGQHRLQAIINTGIDAYVMLVTGLDRKVFTTIDGGKKRSHSDNLSIAGYDGRVTDLSSGARIAMHFSNDGEFRPNGPSGNKRVSPEDLVIYVEKHPKILDSVTKFSQKTKGLLPASVAIGCHYVFSLVDEEAADEFMRALISGQDLKEGNPILALRNRLISMRKNDFGAGTSWRNQLVVFMVHAFNYYRAGKEIRLLRPFQEKSIKIEGFKESVLSNW